MTTYTKTMSEALNQVYLGEDNMALMKKAAAGSAQKLKMKDGKVTMDSFTASAIMQVYKAINPKNKKTMENVVNTGTITALQKLQSLAMRQIKSGDEVEHDGEELDEWTVSDVEIAMKKKYGKIDKEAIEKLKKVQYKGNVDRNDLVKVGHGKLHVESVELDEAKYELYHKDFSTAMQHAYKMAKKLHGITVDPEEIDDKVASGPRKPSEGKTNKYRLKGDKGAIQVQVYNKGGSKPFELNMYKEEVELDEGTILVADPKTQKVIKIDEKDWPKYEKKGYVQAEGNELGEATKWKMGDGRPRGGAYIENERFWDLDRDALLYIMKDADAAMKANPTGRKAGKYADEVNDAHTVLGWRKKNGIKEEVELDEKKTITLFKSKQPTAYDRMRRRMNPKDSKTVDASDEKQIKDLESRGWHRSPYDEEADLDEGKMKDLSMKIDDIVAKMKKDKNMKGFADKFKKDAMKSMDIEKSLEKVLPDYIAGKEIQKLMDEGARADAKRAMRKDKEIDPADVDSSASDDDVKAASKNIIMQMRKVISLRGNFKVEFGDKKKMKIDPKIAAAVQDKYNSMRKADDKEKFQAKVAKSYKDMLSALKESIAEGGYVGRKDPIPAGKELAKLMKKKKGKKEDVQEGTWALPDTPKLMAGLKKLMQKPIPLGKDGDSAINAIGKYIGDDGLYDDLYDAGKKDGPKADARPVIRGWMDREFVDSWKKYRIETTTILGRIDKKLKERKNG